MINVRWLEALRAVITSRTVTEAAARLHVTQPAVSRMIANLEHELGFPLFSRDRGRLTITAQGEAFYAEAERALAGLEEIGRIGRGIRFGGGAVLRLFAMSSLVGDVVPMALRKFVHDYPTVRTSLEIRGGRDITHWGGGRQFDLGAIMVPRGHVMHQTRPFAHAPALAVMSADHPLATEPSVDLEALGAERMVLLPGTSLLRRWIDGRFAQARIVPTVVAETSSIVSACQFAAAGLGVTIADPFAVHSLHGLKLAVRPISPPMDLTFSFVLPLDRQPTQMVARLMEEIGAAATGLLDALAEGPNRITRLGHAAR